MENKEKVMCEFTLTDRSEGLSMKDLQKAAFTLFPTPVRFPENDLKRMTLEQFIIGDN